MDARALLKDYIDQIARFAFQEFNMVRVAQDQVVDVETLDIDHPLTQEKWRFRDVIRREIDDVKTDLAAQVDVLVDAAERGEGVDEAIERHLDEVLATDVFYQAVDDEARDAFRDDMAGFFRDAYAGYAPLVAHDADDVWDAVRDVYGRDEAEAALGTPFTRTPILDRYRDDLLLVFESDEVTILVDDLDYTEEMLRILEHGEDYVRRVIEADVEDAFG